MIAQSQVRITEAMKQKPMTKQPNFKIFISGNSSSVEEWKRALQAPRSELPPLDDQRKEIARKFEVTGEEYARGLLAGQYGEERMQGRGQGLGEEVEKILEGLGPDHRLVAVVGEMFKSRWILRIQTPERVVNILVPRELADDVLDSAAMDEIEKLRQCVLSGLGRKKFIVKH